MIIICGTTLIGMQSTPTSAECRLTPRPVTLALRRRILGAFALFPAPSVVHLSVPHLCRALTCPDSLKARKPCYLHFSGLFFLV